VPSRTDGPSLDFDLARLVPPDALALVSVSDVPAFLEGLSRTGIAKALADERVATFVREIVAGLPREAAELHAAGLLLARGLGPSLCGEALAALLDTGRRDGAPALGGVFLADVSGRGAEARAFLTTMLTLRFMSGTIRAAKIAGVDAVVCRSGGDTVAWCECDGLLAVATSERALAMVLVRRPTAKGAPAGLESFAPYRRAMAGAKIDGRVDYHAYADVERLVARALGDRAASFRASYGIEGIRAAALTGRLNGAVREAMYLVTGDASGKSQEPSGIVTLIGGPRIGLDAASKMPPETILAAFGTVDGRRLSSILADPRSLGGAPKAVALLVNLLGRESARRILEGVRGEAAVAAWNDGHVGWFPRAAAVATAGDPVTTQRTLESAWRSMAKRMKGRFLPRRGRWTGHPAREVTLGYVEGPEFFVPLVGSPAYGLDGNTLVVGPAATAVSRVIGESAGLAATDGFRSLLANFPPERSAFVYVNAETLVERALEPHGPAVLEGLFPGLSARLDREKLPPGEAVARYLGPAGVSAARIEGGIRVDAVTPTGLAAAVLLAQALF